MNEVTAVLRYDQTATLRAVHHTTFFRIKSAQTQLANILFRSDFSVATLRWRHCQAVVNAAGPRLFSQALRGVYS